MRVDQSICSGDAVTLTATSSATINWGNETSLSFDGSSSTVNISSSSVTGSSSFICKFNFNSSNLPPMTAEIQIIQLLIKVLVVNGEYIMPKNSIAFNSKNQVRGIELKSNYCK